MLLKKIIHKIVLFDGKNLDNKYQGAVMIHQSSQSQPMFQFHCFVNCAYDVQMFSFGPISGSVTIMMTKYVTAQLMS